MTGEQRTNYKQLVRPLDPQVVRAWALSAGFQISNRGAIPRFVLTAYRAEHGLSLDNDDKTILEEKPLD